MDRELERRVEMLEEEVRSLKQELSQLKRETNETSYEPSPIKSTVSQLKKVIFEQPMMTIERNESAPTLKKEQPPAKPKRSLEETITWALPKVFTVILVLGVLWGLKLVSEYGYLSDGVKILLAYALSIGLIVLPYVLEKKQKSSPAVIISLYGGAFMIGILTTAAGTILYEIISLSTALVIAILYIVYGIVISYYKANEVLTIFVIFTSLLLPYLLEYMDFSELLIIQFVVLLFAVIQFVIVKHSQQIALYVTTAFTLLSALGLWGLSEQVDMYFAVGILFIVTLFLYSWWRLYDTESKWKATQEGLLFSYNVFVLLLLWVVINQHVFDTVIFLIMLTIFAVTAVVAYKEQRPQVVDVAATVAFLSLTFTLFTFSLSYEMDMLLHGLVVFVGMMLALRLRATIMKVTYSFAFFIVTMITMAMSDVDPFFTLSHLSLVMLLLYFIAIYMYVKQPKHNLTRFEVRMEKAHVDDILPVVITVYFISYVVNLDYAYMSTVGNVPYVAFIALALLLVASFFMPEKWMGRFFVIALVFGNLMAVMVVLLTGYYYEAVWQLNFLTRGVYVAVLLSVLADFYRSGRIYKRWEGALAEKIEQLMNAGIVLFIVLMMSVFSLLYNSSLVDYAVAVTGNTMTIFAVASITLMLGAKRSWRDVKIMGFVLLGIGIFKLIFFDLSALDLLVRSALFIVIGGVGLLLSNRLLRK
ncbi:DUF2339 domain-containing protein [Lysinibacillus sp. KU-BSD001]|uniref:DUF2339 domain-containing protein n=1 Tax=Lysinibacillus sp. KU-BSD001 TaxID=3141328 RepID=UPI0036EC43F8